MEFQASEGMPPSEIIAGIQELYSEVFGGEKDFLARELPRKTNPLVIVALDEGKVVGFKIGYERDNSRTFYSWLGAVHPAYRRQGIASTLMRQQHDW